MGGGGVERRGREVEECKDGRGSGVGEERR